MRGCAYEKDIAFYALGANQTVPVDTRVVQDFCIIVAHSIGAELVCWAQFPKAN